MDLTDTTCPKCGMHKSYTAEFDAYYCKSCNEWLEDICTDRDCTYCNSRPLTPKEIND